MVADDRAGLGLTPTPDTGERLSRVQVIGVGIIATGVATLAALRAFPG